MSVLKTLATELMIRELTLVITVHGKSINEVLICSYVCLIQTIIGNMTCGYIIL